MRSLRNLILAVVALAIGSAVLPGCVLDVCVLRPCGGCYDIVISKALEDTGAPGSVAEAGPVPAHASGSMAN